MPHALATVVAVTAALGGDVSIVPAWGQATIEIVPDEPCFLNSTAPHRIIQNCDAPGNWIGWAMAPWDWVTGGSISMAIAGILIVVSWARYRTAIYPIFIGVVMLPLSYFLFPAEFLSFAFLLAALAVGIYLWWAITRQTD